MTEKKNFFKLKSLIRFHSANKIDNYNAAGGGKQTNKQKAKETTEQVKT